MIKSKMGKMGEGMTIPEQKRLMDKAFNSYPVQLSLLRMKIKLVRQLYR